MPAIPDPVSAPIPLSRRLPGCCLGFALLLSQAGCALHIIDKAPESGPAPEGLVIVQGRINYIIDGEPKTPYGAFKPAWPAPFVGAVQLESGEPWESHAVDRKDGSFRWALPPGAYLMTRIGVGMIGYDTYIAWPRVLLCVPSGAREVYVGHLRLEGESRVEPVTLSTGRSYVSRYISYRFRVVDESPPGGGSAAAGLPRRLMQVREDLPIGESLRRAWQADRAAVLRQAGCD